MYKRCIYTKFVYKSCIKDFIPGNKIRKVLKFQRFQAFLRVSRIVLTIPKNYILGTVAVCGLVIFVFFVRKHKYHPFIIARICIIIILQQPPIVASKALFPPSTRGTAGALFYSTVKAGHDPPGFYKDYIIPHLCGLCAFIARRRFPVHVNKHHHT